MTFGQPEQVDPAGARVVTVAVITYRRAAELARLLPDLLREAGSVAPPAGILVVDNDPEGSARDVVAVAGPSVRYVVEPAPGIAAARNRALAEAGRDSLLVFIDDDEHPRPGWLAALVALQRRTGAAGVTGPAISEYDVEPEPWVLAARFRRPRYATGTAVPAAATNNLLLDLAQVRRLGVEFDARFGLTGGSDTLFTRRLRQLGGVIVWCDEAVVTDRVPVSRCTRQWVLRRAFRLGNSDSRASVVLARTPAERAVARARAAGRGAVRIAGGWLFVLLGRLSGSVSRHARGRRTASRGAGMLVGAFGGVYTEYARLDARTPEQLGAAR